MKIAIVNGLINILGEVKFLTSKDKTVRDTLLEDYKRLRKEARRADETRQDVVDKFNSDYAEKDRDGDEFKNGLVVLNKAVLDILNEDVYVDIESVPFVDFTAILGAESLTLEQIAFLMEWGIIKDEQ